MSTEDNKTLVRRWYEDFNQRNLTIVDELFTPDYVYHNPPTTLHGREEFKQFLSLYLTAGRFPRASSRDRLRFTSTGAFQ